MQLLELIVSEGWRSRKTTAELEQAYYLRPLEFVG